MLAWTWLLLEVYCLYLNTRLKCKLSTGVKPLLCFSSIQCISHTVQLNGFRITNDDYLKAETGNFLKPNLLMAHTCIDISMELNFMVGNILGEVGSWCWGWCTTKACVIFQSLASRKCLLSSDISLLILPFVNLSSVSTRFSCIFSSPSLFSPRPYRATADHNYSRPLLCCLAAQSRGPQPRVTSWQFPVIPQTKGPFWMMSCYYGNGSWLILSRRSTVP